MLNAQYSIFNAHFSMIGLSSEHCVLIIEHYC
jgi:hypothetical protein